jgi:hypothetical protein
MGTTFGAAGESAQQQAERRRERREKLERLERDERRWESGAAGEQSTGEVIAARCRDAVVLHDRRMPHSVANIDHIALVPSGVWVIDSKRVRGRIKVEDRRDGAQKLTINGDNRTELVHKLTMQVNAVKAVIAELAPRVPVHGAFCFWLPINRKRDFITVPDSGLPLLAIWTINGYPLWHRRQMVRQLNAAGTLARGEAQALGAHLAQRFPAAAASGKPTTATTSDPPPPPQATIPRLPAVSLAPNPAPSRSASPSTGTTSHAGPALATGRVSKEEYKERKQAEQLAVWQAARNDVEAALGQPVPPLLSDRLQSDPAIYCHHTLWHSRVYLACVHGQVGRRIDYRRATSEIGAHHRGRTGPPQWRALRAFLEHLRDHGYMDFDPDADNRLTSISILADLNSPPPRRP